MRFLLLIPSILFCHYLYLYLKNYLYDHQLLFFVYTFGYELTYWSCSFFFEYLDRNYPNHEKKLKSKSTSKYTFEECALQSAKNNFVQFFVWNFLFYYFTRLDYKYNDSLLATFIWFFIIYTVFDFTFYVGHFGMHNIPSWKSIHDLHHETYATCGVSCHMMTFPDFIFESLGCGASVIILLFPFGCSPMAIYAFLSHGIMNGVVSHSGWDIWFLNDPRTHFLHHLKYKVNFSGGIFDHVFQTAEY